MEKLILERLHQLPESAQKEALSFIDGLLVKHNPSISKMKRKDALGIWRGKLWMAEDFDEPLEDLAEYM